MESRVTGLAILPLYKSIMKASGGTVTYPPKGRLGPRDQPHIQFVTIHSGHALINIDDQVIFVPTSYVALLCPGHREKFSFAEMTETNHRWVHIFIEYLDEELIQRLEALPRCIPLSVQMNQMTDVICELFQQSSYRDTEDLTRTIAIAMLQLYESDCAHGQQHLQKHSAVLKVIETIHQYYADSLDLKRLANEANVSPEHLIRLFTKYETITPIRYLWKIRVERALELIIYSGLSMKEIVEKTGFQNSHHLSRVILQKTGLTPTEIRKRHFLKS